MSRLLPGPSAGPRRRTGIVGLAAASLVAAVLLPAGAPTAAAPAPAPAPDPSLVTAGAGSLTPAMRAEINQVVSQGRTTMRARRTLARPAALVNAAVRCAEFEGQRYCLHAGWTTRSEAEVKRDLTVSTLAARRTPRENTGGDGDLVADLRQRARMSPAAQARADRRELVRAARSVAKVWVLRHEIQGVPLPDGFLQRHPEVVTADTTTARTARVVQKGFPRRYRILNPKHIRAQNRTYWCGPASMQAVAWGWTGKRVRQRHWARRLGTTTSGSSIWSMVQVTNADTGWDKKRYAGKYIVLDIRDWSYLQWWRLQKRHYYKYKAPIILHPVLLKRFYPYLDDDASGHFQVGRGYDKNGKKAAMIYYFEPWNQRRFDPSEPFIPRTQRRSAYKSYRANQAHFQHNLGV